MRALSLLVVSVSTAGCALFWGSPGTPLAQAAHRGDLAALRSLLAEGADPNAFDPGGQTALHWAARGGHPVGPHDCRGESPHRPDIVAALIEAGADINLADRRGTIPGGSSGWTPLHVALHHEQFVTAARLLERGADPNIRSDQGRSVMAMAAEEGAPAELLQTMLTRGFDPRKTSALEPAH